MPVQSVLREETMTSHEIRAIASMVVTIVSAAMKSVIRVQGEPPPPDLEETIKHAVQKTIADIATDAAWRRE